MERRKLLKLAERLLRLPTAPYHEHAVREFVIKYCHKLGLRVEQDRAGNVIVKYGKGRAESSTPLVFVAHMDHPGFAMLGGSGLPVATGQDRARKGAPTLSKPGFTASTKLHGRSENSSL